MDWMSGVTLALIPMVLADSLEQAVSGPGGLIGVVHYEQALRQSTGGWLMLGPQCQLSGDLYATCWNIGVRRGCVFSPSAALDDYREKRV